MAIRRNHRRHDHRDGFGRALRAPRMHFDPLQVYHGSYAVLAVANCFYGRA